jgi:hypothetical protein
VVRASDATLAALTAAGAIVVDNVNIAFALSDFIAMTNDETEACGSAWNRYGITGVWILIDALIFCWIRHTDGYVVYLHFTHK